MTKDSSRFRFEIYCVSKINFPGFDKLDMLFIELFYLAVNKNYAVVILLLHKDTRRIILVARPKVLFFLARKNTVLSDTDKKFLFRFEARFYRSALSKRFFSLTLIISSFGKLCMGIATEPENHAHVEGLELLNRRCV